jgi:hypothetical protein
MNLPLQQKRALITGGSRGIGAAIVKRLAREGAHVALTYVSKPDQANETVQAAQAFGVQALAIQADSADAKAVTAAVDSRWPRAADARLVSFNVASPPAGAPAGVASLQSLARRQAGGATVCGRAAPSAGPAGAVSRSLPRGVPVAGGRGGGQAPSPQDARTAAPVDAHVELGGTGL